MRRRAALLLAAMLLLVLAVPAHAAGEDSLQLRTRTTQELYPGETAWIHLSWRSKEEPATDVEITASSRDGVAVAYPSDRGWSSFMDGKDLARKATDVTALRVTIPSDASGSVRLDVTGTFEADGERERVSYRVTIPIRSASGDPYELLDAPVSVPAGTPQWVHVHFRGFLPTSDFSVTSPSPQGFAVHHPTGRSDSSLYLKSTLDPDSRDYIGLLVDPGELAPGTYDLPLRISTSHGVEDATVRLEVTG